MPSNTSSAVRLESITKIEGDLDALPLRLLKAIRNHLRKGATPDFAHPLWPRTETLGKVSGCRAQFQIFAGTETLRAARFRYGEDRQIVLLHHKHHDLARRPDVIVVPAQNGRVFPELSNGPGWSGDAWEVWLPSARREQLRCTMSGIESRLTERESLVVVRASSKLELDFDSVEQRRGSTTSPDNAEDRNVSDDEQYESSSDSSTGSEVEEDGEEEDEEEDVEEVDEENDAQATGLSANSTRATDANESPVVTRGIETNNDSQNVYHLWEDGFTRNDSTNLHEYSENHALHEAYQKHIQARNQSIFEQDHNGDFLAVRLISHDELHQDRSRRRPRDESHDPEIGATDTHRLSIRPRKQAKSSELDDLPVLFLTVDGTRKGESTMKDCNTAEALFDEAFEAGIVTMATRMLLVRINNEMSNIRPNKQQSFETKVLEPLRALVRQEPDASFRV